MTIPGVGGAPLKIDDTIKAVLTTAFMAGCTDLEACQLADINQTTLSRYERDNPEFRLLKQRLKSHIPAQAKNNIRQAIDAGNLDLSKFALERLSPDYRRKDESRGPAVPAVVVIDFSNWKPGQPQITNDDTIDVDVVPDDTD